MATYEWESITLGQNAKIQEIAKAAATASELVTTNIGLAKSGLQLAQVFLLATINPKVILLNAIADEIDNFVNDFKNTGFFILEVVPTGLEVIPRDIKDERVKITITRDEVLEKYDEAIKQGADMLARFDRWAERKLGETIDAGFPRK